MRCSGQIAKSKDLTQRTQRKEENHREKMKKYGVME
jgi:hypothetical protein